MVSLDVFFPIFSDSGWFREADSANFRVGKDDRWDVFVGQVGLRKVWWSEEAVGKVATCCYCNCSIVRALRDEV
jgi:hypothetical protein